jgi:hypothetical protein
MIERRGDDDKHAKPGDPRFWTSTGTPVPDAAALARNLLQKLKERAREIADAAATSGHPITSEAAFKAARGEGRERYEAIVAELEARSEERRRLRAERKLA